MMTKKTTSALDKMKEKVEETGIEFEQAGYSPMAGRVFAYLLMAEPNYQSFYEIQEFLVASKSAISNALKYLMQDGIVDYITFSGDRKRYFKVNTSAWLKIAKERATVSTKVKSYLEDILQFRKESENEDFNEGIREIKEFYEYLASKIPLLIEEWEQKRS